MSNLNMPETLSLDVNELNVIVTATDEGLVLDVWQGEDVIATTWKFYEELGLKKGDNNA